MDKCELRHRNKIHVRSINCIAYASDDGKFDIEATLVDTKPFGFVLPERGLISPGEHIHEMTIWVTIDKSLVITDVGVTTVHSPYGVCSAINETYRQLVGLRIGPGFGQTVKRLFRGTAGCSHLTELLPAIATTAFQAIWGDPARIGEEGMLSVSEDTPSPVDGCHAMRSGGEIVEAYFPKFSAGTPGR